MFFRLLLVGAVVLIASALEKEADEDAKNGQNIRHWKAADPDFGKVGPKKLLLISKAIHEVTKSQCQKYVDGSELDMVQAYVNRQILKGDVQTLRHPLHFQKMYQTISECAARVNPDNLRSDSKDEVTSSPDISTTIASQAQVVTTQKDYVQMAKPTARIITTATTTSSTEKTLAPPPVPPPPVPVKPKTHAGKGSPKHRTTVVDKIVNNATQFANKIIDMGKQFFRSLSSGGSFKSWFGRRKRSVSSTTPFYTREYIQVPSEIPRNSSNDSYAEIWSAVTAEESRKVAYDHFIKIFKAFLHIISAQCVKQMNFERSQFQRIFELMSLLVDEDLKTMEDSGMKLRINEKVEIGLMNCVSSL